MTDRTDRHVVVGVTPHQPEVVVRQAARFARRFDAALVCAHVDTTSYVVAEEPDGSVTRRLLDPDLADWAAPEFDAELAERLRTVGREEQVPVLVRELAGDVPRALARLAEVLSAEMIVVGSRRRGFRSSVHDLLGGSVAAHLVHRQPRPVVVVPLAPVGPEDRLPWEAVP